MTNSEKRAWLDWAVEIGLFVKPSLSGKIYWTDKNNSVMAEIIGFGELIILDDLEFLVRDEIDKRGWLLTQQDFADFNSDFTHFKITYDCHIRRWSAETKKMARVEVNGAESRLDALMEAFREACEAGG